MRRMTFLALLFLTCTSAVSRAQTPTAVVDSLRTPHEIEPTAPGTVYGVVSDLETGKALPYTNIVYYEVLPSGDTKQIGGTMAVGPGQYWATLPPGRYQMRFIYLGYEKLTTEPFDLGPAQQLTLDIALKVKPIEMEMIAIQATAITNTEVAQLERQRKAVAVQDALSAQQISKSTDSNVAEALERVTGLSVVGGKFVFVRGLGDRYSSTSLNGASLSSPEPNRRTVPLDIFPSAMLDNVVVQKAYTPDMPGEFGGGNIDVRTREAIDRRQVNVQIKGGVSTNVLNDGFASYQGGGLDWLGVDDGTRALPSTLDPWAEVPLPPRKSLFSPGLETSELVGIRESFTNTWTPRSQANPINSGYNLMYADAFSVGGRDGSVLLAGSLSNSFNTRVYEEFDYRGSKGNVSTRANFDVAQSSTETLLGITGALNFRPAAWSNVSYNYLYTRGSEDNVRAAEGFNDDPEQTIRQHSLTFIERRLTSHVLQGNMAVGAPGSNLHWLGSYSSAMRNEPDRRYSEFQWTKGRPIANEDDEIIGSEPDFWGASPLQYPFQRVFGESEEEDRGLKLDYDWRLPTSSVTTQGLKFGWEIRDRDRFTGYRRFGITCKGCEYQIADGNAEVLFDRDAVENPALLDEVIIKETTNEADTYDAGQQVTGYFAMADIDAWETFRIVGGARFEDSRQFVIVKNRYVAAEDLEERNIRLDRQNILPAVNGTWRLNERTNFRVGYSKTVNRPEMRELSPFTNFNYESSLEEQGNAYLDQAVIDSYDLRLETYPGMRRYAAVSGFYKTFDSPIERLFIGQSAGNLKEFPGNGNKGELYGVELEWRGSVNHAMQNAGQVGMGAAWVVTRPFWLLGKVPGLSGVGNLAPDWKRVGDPDILAIRNFGFMANYSRIVSETDVNRSLLERQAVMTTDPIQESSVVEEDGDVFKTGPLTGQSTYALNFGLIYGDNSRDASLMVKDFGDRLYAFGTGVVPDVYERVPVTLDFAFTQRFRGFRVKFTAENLLDRTTEWAYDKGEDDIYRGAPNESGEREFVDDPLRRSWRDGRRFAVSLSWSL